MLGGGQCEVGRRAGLQPVLAQEARHSGSPLPSALFPLITKLPPWPGVLCFLLDPGPLSLGSAVRSAVGGGPAPLLPAWLSGSSLPSGFS